MNKFLAIGTIGNDIYRNTTDNNTQYIRFNILIDRNYTKDVKDTINCIAWKNVAENINKYCKKGDMIAITASIQNYEYTDKNNNKRNGIQAVIQEVDFINNSSNNNTDADDKNQIILTPTDEDLPF